MPDSPQNIEQRIMLQLEQHIKGDDVIRHLNRVQKSLKATQKLLSKSAKGWDTYSKTLKTARNQSEQLAKSQRRVQQQLTKTTRGLRDSTRQASRSERTFSRLGRTLSRVAGFLGVGSLGFLAFRKFQNIVDSRINLAVTGGANQIRLLRELTKGSGIPLTSSAALLAGFQQQSPFNRFSIGRDTQSIRGLLGLQKALQPIGLELGRELILGVTSGLESGSIKTVLRTATADPELALLRGATGQNIQAITSALNALEIGKLAGEQRLDPSLQAAIDLRMSMDSLNASIERLMDNLAKDLAPAIKLLADGITKLAGIVDKLDLKSIGLGVAGAAAVALFGPGIAKGVLKGVGKGGKGALDIFRNAARDSVLFGRNGRGVPGSRMNPLKVKVRPFRPPAGLPGRPGLPGSFPLGFPAAGGGGAAGGGALGTAGAGALALAGLAALGDSIYSTVKGKELSKFNLPGRAGLAVNNLFTGESDKMERLRLANERNKAHIENKMNQLDPRVKKMLIANGPEAARRLQDKLDRQNKPSVTKGLLDSIRELSSNVLDKARQGIDKLKQTLVEMEKAALRARVAELQRQAARRRDLELRATEQASITQLRRQEHELARIAPMGMGPFLAIGELSKLLEQINKEIQSLEKILSNIDVSTRQGRIEANSIRDQINRLRIESKSLRVEQMEALVNGAIGEAMGSIGHFSKILITGQQNVAKGLEMGIINPPKGYEGLFGRVGADARKHNRVPIPAAKVYGLTRQPKARRSGFNLIANNSADTLMDAAEMLSKAAKQLRDEQISVAEALVESETPRAGAVNNNVIF